MDIASDDYFITNAKFSVSLAIADPRESSTSVVATPSTGENNSRWRITRLQGQRYRIQHYENQEYQCWFQSPPNAQDTVKCKRNASKEWIIKPKTGEFGGRFYTISPADNQNLFWGIEDGLTNTEVELKTGSTLESNRWRIHRAPLIVDQIVDATKMDFEWMDTTNDPFEAQVAVRLESERYPRPEGSYISFPEPLDVIWNGKLLGKAEVSGRFLERVHQVDRAESNTRIIPRRDGLITEFIQSIIKEKSILVEVATARVDVFASGREYKNADVDFRKTVTLEGFNNFEGCINIQSVRVVGSHPRGKGITAEHDILITNPSNVSVKVDDIPVEIRFKDRKIGSLNIPKFKLHRKSAGTVDTVKAVTQFQPEDPKHTECQEFIKDYITTNRNLEVSCNLTGTVITLGASHKVSIPPFSVLTSVTGVNKQFLKGATAYISLIRTPLWKNVAFKFEIENPVHTDVKIIAFEGEVKRKGDLFCIARASRIRDFVIQGDRTQTSSKFKGGSVKLSRLQMPLMLFKGSLKVNVTVTKATVHIGQFELPDLQFELEDPIRVKLKKNLFFF